MTYDLLTLAALIIVVAGTSTILYGAVRLVAKIVYAVIDRRSWGRTWIN